MKPCLSAATCVLLLSSSILLPAQVSAQQEGTALVGGTYVGEWPDGRSLTVTTRMLTPDMITLQRQSYSSTPVTYRRVEPGRFRDRNGNSLIVMGPTRIEWVDDKGRNRVTFDRAE